MDQESVIDYYDILQLSPRADQETIERVTDCWPTVSPG